MKFAYADPPYFGMGKKLYSEHHPEASDWDDPKTHHALITRLYDEYPDGWTLSCNPRDLRMYLPWCQETIRVCSWVKPWHQIRPTTVQFAWEPVLFTGGRKDNKRAPMVRDWFMGNATRGMGLPGAKSLEFMTWVSDLLNYQEGDTLDDLFPGTGAVERLQANARLL